jgi:Do/DeqQ family serine protease
MRRLFLILLLVSAGFAAGLVLTGRMRTAERATAAPTGDPTPAGAAAAAEQPAARSGDRTLASGPDFTDVAARTVNAVTNISSLQPVRRQNTPFSNDPFFQYFFGDMDVFGDRGRRELSLGSGVVVSPDGYILTNVHVLGALGRGTEVRVAMADKRELRAQVVGADQATDIALVKINARDLPVIPWGDSSKLKVAEWVLAIGNPYQLNQTVTLGIVSALGRSNIGAAGYEDFIQTDAAINPGNSGGALINSRGELIGINTAIFSQSGGYQGIGFAVPSNLAHRVMKDLIEYGDVQRGSIGYFDTIPLTPDIAAQLETDRTRGIVVNRMDRNGAAYEAGVRPGDIILALNDTAIIDGAQLERLIADTKSGSTVRLKVARGTRELTFNVPVEIRARRRQVSY